VTCSPIAKLSVHCNSPSAEGRRALALIEAVIASFEAHNRIVEPKAFEALHEENDISSISSSSSLHCEQTTVISVDNLDVIALRAMDEMTVKTMEIVEELQSKQCASWRLQIVPKDFYLRDLEYRAMHYLSAASPESLCKSLLMKNAKCLRDDCNDPRDSKYYLVMFQYTKKMKQQKFKKFVKTLGNKSNKYYKFSLASLEETRALTHFEYNTVSPIGIGNVPIIVSHHVLDQDQIWMGSGSLDVKLRIKTAEFLRKFPHFVADITY